MNAAQRKAEVAKLVEKIEKTDLRRDWMHVRIAGQVYLVFIYAYMNAAQIAQAIAEAPRYALNLSRKVGTGYYVA